MADVHIEDHPSLIKTPQQLIVVVIFAFVVPVAAILLIVHLITGGMRVDPNSAAMTEEAIANRLKPVGQVNVVAGGSDQVTESTGAGAGQQLFSSVCQACHAVGLAGAPKTGDKAAWQPRLAQGIDTLYQSAINGKNAMPPKGGASDAADATVKAAVDIMVSKVQ